MRLIIVCDADGAIVSTTTMPTGGLRLSMPTLPVGQREVELDAPDILENMDHHEIHRQLSDLKKRSCVGLSQDKHCSTQQCLRLPLEPDHDDDKWLDGIYALEPI